MKGFVLKRPLFCACVFSLAVAIILALIGTSYAFLIISVLAFLLLLVLPLKSKLKLPAIVAIVMSICIVVTSYVYYEKRYEDILKYNDNTTTAYATVVSISGNEVIAYCSETIDGEPMGFKVGFEWEEQLLPSTEIKADFSLYPAEDNKQFSSNGVHVYAFVNNVETVNDVKTHSVIYIYHKFREKVNSCFEFSNKQLSGFIKGMVLGDKEATDKVLYNKLITIGMSHVMSVSGMHLVFAVVFFDIILALFGLHYKPRSLVSILAALAFTVISGFSVSCIRSFIMLFVYYIGRFTEKISDGLTSLALSAYIIILFMPYNLGDISFVLSVLATFGMIVISPTLSQLIDFKANNRYLNAFLHVLKSSVIISLSANIACLPVMIFVFKSVSLIAAVSNVILLVPIQILFYLSFIYLLFTPFRFFAQVIEAAMNWIYGVVANTVDFLYELKYITITDGNSFFYISFALLFALLVGIFVYQKKKVTFKIYPYVAVYAIACIAMFCVTYIQSNNIVDVRFVDVGQGNSTFITKDEHAVVVDCGGDDIDELYVTLRQSKVKYIDLIAITHADGDHIKYISYLINRYKVDKIIYPEFCDKEKLSGILELAKERKIQTHSLSKDESFNIFGNAKLKAFVEPAFEIKIKSNTSALYKFEYGDTSICFTGDMAIHQERKYLDYGQQLDCDILLVAHHGSSKATYSKILDLYSPEISVISVSKDNMYGMPDDRVVKRLSERSAVFSTADYSTIRFILKDKGYKAVINEH